ncbi:17334_t:CDS:2, partial [Racocetra fulgida]
MAENNNKKVLPLPNQSGQLNRIQEEFNRLTDEIKRLKKENDELKKNNSSEILKKIKQQAEEYLTSLKAEYNKNATLDQKMNDLVKTYKEVGKLGIIALKDENKTLKQQLENCNKEKEPLKNTNDSLKKQLE